MDLRRMLEKCRRDQWTLADIDWTRPPRELSPADEQAVVQYFTNMAGIERLAAALFQEQHDKSRDPTLRAIFATFVADEERHALVAERLARHYDARRLRVYRMDPALERFTPHFVAAVRHLSAEIANLYITTGELILDVALLRSLHDYVDDDVCRQAMALINRDESRHIAVDFHMVEHYASDAYQAEVAGAPPQPLAQRLRAWWALANMFYFAAPFFREVFFRPMDLLDPTGRRILEAFKRVQLLGARRRVARRPFNAFVLRLQALHEHPLAGPLVGRWVERVLGLRPAMLRTLYSEAEAEWARRSSMDELAEAALAAKYAGI